MARKPRLEMAGALYHVSNRGHSRSDLFVGADEAQVFVDCLFQACQRMQWKLHAFSLQPDQYHLALETPRGNLVAGVHWLQSAFGNRFSRTRGASARAFRGRYQAIMVEPGPMWAHVVDYIHLGPVLSKVVPFDHLGAFRWSSYRFFVRPDLQPRPSFLVCGSWMQTLGLADDPAGWAAYSRRLDELRADPVRVKATFGGFGRGWAYGSPEFRRSLAEQLASSRTGQAAGPSMAENNRREWHVQLDSGLKQLRRDLSEAAAAPKSAPWKIALAAWLKSNTSVLNRWLSEQLHMGPPDAVSRYVGELRLGKRPAAAEEYSMLGGSDPAE
jgi:putative transposase